MYIKNHSLGEWLKKAYGDEARNKIPFVIIFVIIKVQSINCTKNSKRSTLNMRLNDINSLLHTKWKYKYHIILTSKYRRKVFYEEKRIAVGKILR